MSSNRSSPYNLSKIRMNWRSSHKEIVFRTENLSFISMHPAINLCLNDLIILNRFVDFVATLDVFTGNVDNPFKLFQEITFFIVHSADSFWKMIYFCFPVTEESLASPYWFVHITDCGIKERFVFVLQHNWNL